MITEIFYISWRICVSVVPNLLSVAVRGTNKAGVGLEDSGLTTGDYGGGVSFNFEPLNADSKHVIMTYRSGRSLLSGAATVSVFKYNSYHHTFIHFTVVIVNHHGQVLRRYSHHCELFVFWTQVLILTFVLTPGRDPLPASGSGYHHRLQLRLVD